MDKLTQTPDDHHMSCASCTKIRPQYANTCMQPRIFSVIVTSRVTVPCNIDISMFHMLCKHIYLNGVSLAAIQIVYYTKLTHIKHMC